MRFRPFVAAFALGLLVVVAACAPQPPPATTPAPLGATCFDLPDELGPGGRDLLYSGTPDRLGNLRVMPSTDGSCSGIDPAFLGLIRSVVTASDQGAAVAKCEFLFGAALNPFSFPPPGYEPTTTNLWDCGLIG